MLAGENGLTRLDLALPIFGSREEFVSAYLGAQRIIARWERGAATGSLKCDSEWLIPMTLMDLLPLCRRDITELTQLDFVPLEKLLIPMLAAGVVDTDEADGPLYLTSAGTAILDKFDFGHIIAEERGKVLFPMPMPFASRREFLLAGLAIDRIQLKWRKKMKEEGRKCQPGFIFVLSYLNIRPLSPLEFAELIHEKLEGRIYEMLIAMDQEGLVIVPDKTIPMQLTELGRQLVSEFHPKHMT
jgi:hypothetical protein